MESKVNYALVGAFVVILGSALLLGVLWLAAGGGLAKKYDVYLALVGESVAGLNLNAPVKYRGVDVGKVKDIRLDPANPAQVRLLFAIERDTPIKEDTEAVLKTQGLTGIAYVELDGSSQASPPLRAIPPEEYPVIRTKPSLSARLENVLTTVLAKLDSTSDSVNKVLSPENLAAFKSTLADLATLARTLAARQATIDRGITSAARTFDNTARGTERLGPVIEHIGQSADAVRQMADAVGKTSVSAGQAVDTLGAEVRHFSSDTVPELQNLLGELNSLTLSLRHLIEETERNPRAFIFGRQPMQEGPGEKSSEGAAK